MASSTKRVRSTGEAEACFDKSLELVRRLRGDPRFVRTAIIMVTSETATEQVVEALEAGADEYLMKPFSADVLIAKLVMLEEEQELEELDGGGSR